MAYQHKRLRKQTLHLTIAGVLRRSLISELKEQKDCPYSETEIWDREEISTKIKYEPYKRRAALALLWDLFIDKFKTKNYL